MAAVMAAAIIFMAAGTVSAAGYSVTSDLWIRAVINTVEKGPIDAVWQKGGEDLTAGGHRVIWGYFYASPSDVNWGSQQNPDLFVKIWFDAGGRVDVNFFHVSVPNIDVYSGYPYNGTPDKHGVTNLSRRYIRQYYQNGQNYMDEQYENGEPAAGDMPSANPSGYVTTNTLKIGASIATVEKGPVDAVWRKGGEELTSGGHRVVWGHFYASPSDVSWGSANNPDLFVKIWFDASGRVDVNFFHVSVPNIEVFSDLPAEGDYNRKSTTTLQNRYIRHEYWLNSNGSRSPVAKFSAVLTPSETSPFTVKLDASGSYDPDGEIVRYVWESSAEPGKNMEGKSQILTLPVGTHTITLRVTDNSGLQQMETQVITLTSPVPGTGDFELKKLLFTVESPQDKCAAPASRTSFSDTDTRVIAWVSYLNFAGSKSYEFKWYNPDGALAKTDSGTRGSAAEGCSWISLPVAELQKYRPGRWGVEFYYDGKQYGKEYFDFTSSEWGTEFGVSQFVMTAETPGEKCAPPTSKTSFTDADAKVTAWAYYRNFEAGKSYQIKWYSPGNALVQKHEGTLSVSEASTGGCAFGGIETSELAKYESGSWRVEFYYNNQKYRETYFDFYSDVARPEFEITKFIFSKQSPPSSDSCQEPSSSGTSFDDNVSGVTAYIHYNNFEGGNKPYEFRWYNPGGRTDGKPAQTHTGTAKGDAAGSGCAWGTVSIETLRTYGSGQWAVEFYYDGRQYENGRKFFNVTVSRPNPFTLTEFLFTDAVPDTADSDIRCEKPLPVISFGDADEKVFAWVAYNYFEAKKTYEFKWYSPESTLAHTETGTRDTSLTAGCSWVGISTEKLREYGSGNWRVEFYYDGQKKEEKYFSFVSSNPNMDFEIRDFRFTSDSYSDANKCQTPESKESFDDKNTNVTAWLHYYFFESGKTFDFKWYSPDGKLVQTTVPKGRGELKNGCAWSSMSVNDLNQYRSGQWRVEFYYDESLKETKYFDFTSANTDFEISQFILTKGEPLDNCQKEPVAGTSFGDSDPPISAWIRYYRFEPGKTYQFRWYSPEGGVPAWETKSPLPTTNVSNGCLWESISLENFLAHKSGTWRVEFHYDGQKADEESFTFTSVHSDTEFEITDFLFTSRYVPVTDCEQPTTPRTAFTLSDTDVIAWISYRNFKGDKAYQFRWFNPDNVMVWSNESEPSANTKDISRGCVWASIPIDRVRRYRTGQWRVEFYYDGQKYREQTFTFN